MTRISARQMKAARALLGLSRARLGDLSCVPESTIAQIEATDGDCVEAAVIAALETHGAQFIPDNGGGEGVRLKFSRREARAIDKLENEGGIVGDDDV